MNNEQLLQMYNAIRQQPDLLVKEAARKRLINFSRYMQPDLVLEPFHVVYYTLLDMFAHGKIRKMIVQQPPQHGKSEGSSRKLPAFMEGLNPDLKLLSVRMRRPLHGISTGTYNVLSTRPGIVNCSPIRI